MAQELIVVEGVTRRFDRHVALDGISLAVRPGEVFGLLGHNGAGKTTLIRLVNGLLSPTSGSVRVFGRDPTADGDHVRARTGVLTEYPALDHYLTCRENLAVYASIHGLDRTESARAADRALASLGLTDRADTPAHELSAGLKQRVALARALVHDPELLLLDEPTSNLDPIAGRIVRERVVGLVRDRGRTAVLSTHNLAEAQAMCDRIAIIRQGRLLAIGAVAELASQAGQHGLVVTVDPAQHAEAGRLLAGHVALPPVAHADGASWEVRLDDGGVPRLAAALVGAGIRLHAMVPQRPTLEDVYVRFHDTGPEPSSSLDGHGADGVPAAPAMPQAVR